ncbi:MAG TPA: hypothetical protein VGG97_25170 [Bryobacteraceae bacterium]|jgi:hypothetical protein
MSSSANARPSGIQQLYDTGLLPDSLSQQTLDSASTPQLNQIAANTVALQQIEVLLGNGNGADSVSLSPEAAGALLVQSDSSGNNNGPSDYFTQAVNNQLTNNINSAVNAFLPVSSTHSGNNINVVG